MVVSLMRWTKKWGAAHCAIRPNWLPLPLGEGWGEGAPIRGTPRLAQHKREENSSSATAPSHQPRVGVRWLRNPSTVAVRPREPNHAFDSGLSFRQDRPFTILATPSYFGPGPTNETVPM